MVRMMLPCLMAVLVVGGCRSEKSPSLAGTSKASPPEAASTPQEKLYEQLRSGVFQINSGLDAIEEALNESRKTTAKTGDIRKSLDDIQASIDSAGETLGDEAAVEPDRAKVAADLKAAESRRKSLCDLVNDSLHDLRDARGIVDSLAEGTDAGPLENVGVKIDDAMTTLRSALQALGGAEEVEE